MNTFDRILTANSSNKVIEMSKCSALDSIGSNQLLCVLANKLKCQRFLSRSPLAPLSKRMPNEPRHTRVSPYLKFATKSIANYACGLIRNAFKVWFNLFLKNRRSRSIGTCAYVIDKTHKSKYTTKQNNNRNDNTKSFVHINTIHQIYKMSTRRII